MAIHRISIRNQSGQPQDYSIFTNAPGVSGGCSGEIFSNILETASYTPNGDIASFEIPTNYYAICGNYEGSPSEGGGVVISKSIPVKLGERVSSLVNMGSTVPLIVSNRSSCDLGGAKTPGEGKIANFQISTVLTPGREFTLADAQNHNLFVGVGTSKDGYEISPLATFAPYPNVTYQIQPKAVYYVTAGQSFRTGELIKAEWAQNSLTVDFVARQTNTVTLLHDETNTFSFQ